MRSVPSLALLLLVVAAPPLAAQHARSTAAWHTLVTGEDGTVVTIDSATVDRTGDSTFTVRTAVRFPRLVATASGDRVDREVDAEELDCAGARSRPLASEVYAGESLVRVTLLSNTWAEVRPGRRAVFDASCAYLLGGFAVRLRKSYDLSRVEEQPELINRGAVSAALSREYPRNMRATGQTGTVTLRFRVLEDGTVDRSTVLVQQLTHPDFAEAAIRVVNTMRFRPARLRRVPVPVWVTLPVIFRLQVGPPSTPPGTPPDYPPPFPPLPSRP
ncbi:MAG TPA: energy transducer TonB [Longimicrobium sp.]|jgi:TonB family protein|nr:energy transducer TonB [Longimicrobium sp.]